MSSLIISEISLKSKPGTKSDITDFKMEFFLYFNEENKNPAEKVKLVQTISMSPEIHCLKSVYQKKTCAIILLINMLFLNVPECTLLWLLECEHG